ncbi:General transcription factor II-I repeat domain-containing protein 2 [Merluccius polli]|uniref:General transcription factor II-I repeat domain-containing protein 2 n=1 Tax=Merluccius polli TaxID=89951 RepID=A0AA47NYC2_MERPO|nr:General transcription factor II-I repeat domain-containing protein 2 [Merluccius polli]
MIAKAGKPFKEGEFIRKSMLQAASIGGEMEEAIALHCIIHQQALCSKCLKFDNVMSVVTNVVNHIKSRGLKHRKFCAFLQEIESAYEDVLYFTEVHWFSRGNVLKSFFELRAEVKAFMEKDGMAVCVIHSSHVPVLSDSKWLMDLAFLVDITQALNVLNKNLQGQGQLVSAAFDNVSAFSTKLVLWKAQLSQTKLCHFPACKALMDAGTPFSGEKYAAVAELEFYTWGGQGCNYELKAKFREVSGKEDKLGQSFRELPPTFPELSRMFKRTMCLFGSTYLCEKLKSSKSKYRSKLTEHLQAILRVSIASSLKPNVAQLCKRKRCQVSGSKE